MSRLAIETRLNLLIGTLLLVALAANMMMIFASGGPRIRAENDSMVKLTRETIEQGLAELQGSPQPQRDLARLVERLAGVRHVRVRLDGGRLDGGPPGPGPVVVPSTNDASVTDMAGWIAALLQATPAEVRVPAAIGGVRHGDLVIVPDPSDEIDEIAEALSATATGGLVLIVVLFAVTRLAVRQALAPIDRLGTALAEMQRGNYSVQLSADGPPELAAISTELNVLAGVLAATREDNRRLAEALITLEDQERRDLARELHDELGPYLFAIRASATSLLGDSEGAAGGPGAASDVAGQRRAKAYRAMLDHIEAMQKLNRRVLKRLRPPALAEIGLIGALAGLVALWRENNPEVTIETRFDVPAGTLDGTGELTVYRVVQEGLTNAFRHAGASLIAVDVRAADSGGVRITVADNGPGPLGEVAPGLGLSGMRERVWALGGTLTIGRSAALGGLELAAGLPPATANR